MDPDAFLDVGGDLAFHGWAAEKGGQIRDRIGESRNVV